MANERQPRSRALAGSVNSGKGGTASHSHGLQKSTIAGAAAGTATSILCSPFDVLKTRQQVEGMHAAQSGAPPRRMSVSASVRHVYHSEGVRGFYHGLTPALGERPRHPPTRRHHQPPSTINHHPTI